jgi:hypothetical protein
MSNSIATVATYRIAAQTSCPRFASGKYRSRKQPTSLTRAHCDYACPSLRPSPVNLADGEDASPVAVQPSHFAIKHHSERGCEVYGWAARHQLFGVSGTNSKCPKYFTAVSVDSSSRQPKLRTDWGKNLGRSENLSVHDNCKLLSFRR